MEKFQEGMNAIERFKKGRKVHTRAGQYTVGSFIRLKGENFWRRVNGDGTLTLVGDKEGLYDYLKAPSKVRNTFIRSKGGQKGVDGPNGTNNIPTILKISSPALALTDFVADKLGYKKDLTNTILRNANGTGGWGEFINIPRNARNKYGYYTGKLYADPNATEVIDENNGPRYYSDNKDPNGNMLNLYTHLDDTGFDPSEIGVGIYKNNFRFNKLPAYKGNYYNIDTLYLPKSLLENFRKNLNVSKSINHDVSLLGMTLQQINGTYDAKHFYITPRYINNLYYIDMEDVFDLDKFGIDGANYPFIINQRLPVLFTDDENKLNTVPLSNTWYK